MAAHGEIEDGQPPEPKYHPRDRALSAIDDLRRREREPGGERVVRGGRTTEETQVRRVAGDQIAFVIRSAVTRQLHHLLDGISPHRRRRDHGRNAAHD